MSQPAVHPKKYLLVFAALLVIVAATTLIGRIDLGPFNMPLAILFATSKAVLIAAVFMQAKFESRLIHVIIAAGVVWMLMLMSNTLGDYLTRGWIPFPGK